MNLKSKIKKIFSIGNKDDNINYEKSLLNEWLDFSKDLIVIVIIVLLIRSFLAMPFQISGQSMYSSFYDRQFIIVDRLSYYFKEPRRWDVIVFKPYINDDKKFFLKRIIWVPWDTLKIEWWDVFIRNSSTDDEFVKLDEPYLNDENNWYTFVWNSKWSHYYTLGEGKYFVIWDNRNHSTDSRECFSNCIWRSEYVDKSDIIWRLFIDLWYFNFSRFSFIQPDLWIETKPKFFSSYSTHNFDL